MKDEKPTKGSSTTTNAETQDVIVKHTSVRKAEKKSKKDLELLNNRQTNMKTEKRQHNCMCKYYTRMMMQTAVLHIRTLATPTVQKKPISTASCFKKEILSGSPHLKSTGDGECRCGT